MALKPCKECGKEVSTKADTCPNCGAPAKGLGQQKVGCGTGCLVMFVVGIIIALLSRGGEDTRTTGPSETVSEPQSTTTTAPVPPDSARIAIDEWLTGWSTAQASSMREGCAPPDCDPSRYRPEARPETSFGWDGAQSVERTADWARGPRYRVRANGRTLLMYLEDFDVVGVYEMFADGGRRNLCRDEDCVP